MCTMVRCVESAYNAPYLPVERSLGIVNSALSSLLCITVSPLFETSPTGMVHSSTRQSHVEICSLPNLRED